MRTPTVQELIPGAAELEAHDAGLGELAPED